jgi:hypothetical protein
VLADNRRAAGLDALDAAVMDLAEKVVIDATSVTQADIDRLRRLGLSDTDILDVVLAGAARCCSARRSTPSRSSPTGVRSARAEAPRRARGWSPHRRPRGIGELIRLSNQRNGDEPL